jgi:hypothetical protein
MLRKNDASLRNRTENVAAPIHVWIPILKLCEQVVSAAASTRLKKSSTRAKGDAAHEVLEATVTCQHQNSDFQPPTPRTCTDTETW